ncbi:HpcH/HpaI aldolase/citrate lyase family protein [Tuber borchii]|uniref:HpcH/HpaI aldolase/citrate lyase family protein n=1 Tax=Tuber borchii TaxID=42251 RepID=A0A2T6ZBV4_TUBBO|nr:HpcH/HpaI aldolase/citrate lyase family protein [Tuber borchii]
MQAVNKALNALRTGNGQCFGAWQMLPGHHVSRAIARSGFDWVLIDTEHGGIGDGAMHEAVSAVAGCGVSPIVRIAACEAWMFKRALDAGAHGIMVPLVSTVEEAEAAVKYAKFPPIGVRGYGSPFPMGAFNISSSIEYLRAANDSILTIVQIETKQALENVDAIAAVEGVDVLFVGPFDLGNSLGCPVVSDELHPTLVSSIARIRKAAVKAGKRVGIFCTGGDQARMFAEQGFHMVSVAADMIAIGGFLSAALGNARGGKGAVGKPSGPYGP